MLVFVIQEAYHEMLVKYREELARPIQEAAEFFKSVETQLDSITGSACFLSRFRACRIEKCFVRFVAWKGDTSFSSLDPCCCVLFLPSLLCALFIWGRG